MVRFPDDETDAKTGKLKREVSTRYLPSVTKRTIIENNSRMGQMTMMARPVEGSNIRDVFEGARVNALAFVFDQLAKLGLGKTDQERPHWPRR